MSFFRPVIARYNENKLRMLGSNNKLSEGFTIPELIIVIAVIGFFATALLITFPASQKRATDTERKNDIGQYRISLESYANVNNGLYPVANGNLIIICPSLGLIGASCPDDPKAPPSYQYRSSATGSQYTMWATLEQPDTSGNTLYFIICSNGLAGEDTSAPSDFNCTL